MSSLQETAGAVAGALAAFASRTSAADIPADVRTRAHHHMLDAVGIALASTRFDFAHKTLTAIRGLAGPGDVPVIGMPARLPPRDAATINGFLIHGLDFDDTHLGSIVHPTSSVLPAALSAGAMAGATGEEVTTAYILGIEIAARLGAVARGGFHQVGFHPTGMIGVFACTLVAGRLLGLTEKQMANGQGIALSMASGSLEFLEDGAWNKRLHPGWAAAAGITAAALAREGFVGATSPYGGRFGVFNAYLGKEAHRADLSLATRDLGSVWELLNTAIKPYPACHFTHAGIDAALALVRDGLEVAKIAKVEVLVPADVIKTVCEPEANKKRPANSYDAQFSIPFLVAAALVRKRVTLQELDTEALNDPAILDLATLVSYRADPDSPFPRAYSGEVIVTLTDGTVVRHREHINRGAPDRPLTNGEIVEKFTGNAALTASASLLTEIETAVLGLDRATTLTPLFRALACNRT